MSDGTAPLLAVHDLHKHFGAVQALNGVSLELRAAEVVALAGDNGAGKSVLIKTISGVFHQDEGTIAFEGKPVSFTSPE
ncbi:MAG: ATP-binding cassette domain-containing protein, partial [Bauldia sp.]